MILVSFYIKKQVRKLNKENIYTDFYFNGKKLSDFGGVICDQYENMRSLTPAQNVETKTVAGIDGEIVVATRYGNRTWTENVFFENMVKVRDISAWLGNKFDTDFQYVDDDVNIKARVPDAIDFNMYGSGNDTYSGLMSIPFIAYCPYYKLINPLVYEFSTVGLKKFDNVGNVESMPIIRFEVVGVQNIKFSINDKNYELKNINNWCEIDTRKRTVKDNIGNQRMNFYSEGDKITKFPTLKIGENSFELKLGSIRKVAIECNCRFI